MDLRDLIGLATNGITSRKLRSGLTSLGIIIGAAAFVALVSMGTSVEDQILGELDALGGNDIVVTPGITRIEGGPPSPDSGVGSGAKLLDRDDELAVLRVSGVRLVHGEVSQTLGVAFGGESGRIQVRGVDAQAWNELEDPTILEGRTLRPGDRSGALVSQDVAQDLFSRTIGVGQQITVEDQRFRVVGILEMEASLGIQSEQVIISREAAWDLGGVEQGERTSILARVDDDADTVGIGEEIEKALRRTRGVTEDDQDFTVLTAEELRESIQAIIGTFQVFLGSVAAISLLVGGVGIANTMFMTVLERSKQIGILKSVGMTRREIVTVFLLEAGFLGLIGGILGAALGAFGATQLAPVDPETETALVVQPDPVVMVGMVIFSVVIGAIAGLLPAIRAASVPAVEVLRGD